jgi:hypothetical protein
MWFYKRRKKYPTFLFSFSPDCIIIDSACLDFFFFFYFFIFKIFPINGVNYMPPLMKQIGKFSENICFVKVKKAMKKKKKLILHYH